MILTDDDWLDIEIQINLQEDLEGWKSKIEEDSSEGKAILQQYMQFFQKRSSARHHKQSAHFATRAAKVDLQEIQKKSHVYEIPLNSCSDVVRQIRMLESGIADLDEALLKTYPTKHFVKRCQLFQKKVVPRELQKLSQLDVDGEGSSREAFINSIEMTDFNSKTGVAARVVVPLLVYKHQLKDLEEDIEQLKEAARFNGYFMLQCEAVEPRSQHAVEEGVVAVFMSFEAKYSKIDFQMPKFLYHFTLPEKLQSIAKEGLKPRSSSSVFAYPDRVYLFAWEPSFAKMMYIASEMLESHPGEVALLRVDSKKLEDYGPYRNGKMPFFIDPKIVNLDDEEHPRAIYTYEPIPVNIIDDNVELVEVSANGNIIGRKVKSLRDFM